MRLWSTTCRDKHASGMNYFRPCCEGGDMHWCKLIPRLWVPAWRDAVTLGRGRASLAFGAGLQRDHVGSEVHDDGGAGRVSALRGTLAQLAKSIAAVRPSAWTLPNSDSARHTYISSVAPACLYKAAG